MTYEQFIKKHLVVDWETEQTTLRNIILKNVKTGKEALALSRLFGLKQSSLMHSPGPAMSGFPHSDDYINFVNDIGKSFITVVGNIKYESINTQEYWFSEEIKDYCERIAIEYKIDQTNYDSGVDNLYKMFGMEIL